MQRPWIQALKNPNLWIALLMGFSSGIPLLLIGSTLKFWMREEKIDLGVIGFFSVVGLPLTLKALWAPFVDRYRVPGLGRRRGWLLISQAGLVFLFFSVSHLDPAVNVKLLGFLALAIGFFSATQDIVVDAYRRETLEVTELGLGSSFYVTGYRIALLVAGAGALTIAAHWNWHVVYRVMAGIMVLSLMVTLLVPEPHVTSQPRTLKEAVIEPFHDFFQKPFVWTVLLFVLFFKLGDSMASEMLSPLYVDLGYLKTEVALIAKTFGVASTIGGGILGGILILRWGLMRSLWIFGILQMLSTFGFAILAMVPHSPTTLSVVILFENLSAGMGTSAFLGYLSAITNTSYTATQYALLSSLTAVPRVFLGSITGVLAAGLGYPIFFSFCGLIAVPGLIFLRRLEKKYRPIAG